MHVEHWKFLTGQRYAMVLTSGLPLNETGKIPRVDRKGLKIFNTTLPLKRQLYKLGLVDNLI